MNRSRKISAVHGSPRTAMVRAIEQSIVSNEVRGGIAPA
jgi:hypothetical protein